MPTLEKEEGSQIKNLTEYLNELEKEKVKPKTGRRKQRLIRNNKIKIRGGPKTATQEDPELSPPPLNLYQHIEQFPLKKTER